MLMKWFGPSREERIELAMTKLARLHGDLLACEQMLYHYKRVRAEIDPWRDWWRFAEVSEKVQDKRAERDLIKVQITEAERRLGEIQ